MTGKRQSLWSASETEALAGLGANIITKAVRAPELASLSDDLKLELVGVVARLTTDYIFGEKVTPERNPVLRLVPRAAAK